MNQINPYPRDIAPAHDKAIVPALSRTSLTPRQLEERSIIYRGERSTPEVEAFRELRTRLLDVCEGNFVTLVAPVSAGSGGSFVARNLAAAFAFDPSHSALLIDCDLRNPSQQRTMEVETGERGLVSYLGDSDLLPGDVIRPTGVARLELLPAGMPAEDGAEYFSSHRMRLLIDSLRAERADRRLILDAPPVRGTADARILADLADVVILVVGYGHDTPQAIADAANGFDPAKFAGVVFNEGA